MQRGKQLVSLIILSGATIPLKKQMLGRGAFCIMSFSGVGRDQNDSEKGVWRFTQFVRLWTQKQTLRLEVG